MCIVVPVVYSTFLYRFSTYSGARVHFHVNINVFRLTKCTIYNQPVNLYQLTLYQETYVSVHCQHMSANSGQLGVTYHVKTFF